MKYNYRNNNSGVALVAVLAILVVLTILAASLSALVSIEQKTSATQFNSQKADMLIDSAIEHAKTHVNIYSDINSTTKRVPENLLLNYFGRKTSKNLNWQNVFDKSGNLVGRYRIVVDDEAAKVNINTASLLKKSKGNGWSTSEISLPNALGIPPKIAKQLLIFKYGENRLPGVRGDDNYNNIFLMSDGVDNNANGVIDEFNEGVNEPSEYNAKFPVGDDRSFSSITDSMNFLINSTKSISKKNSKEIRKIFPQRATLYSIDYPGSPTLPNSQPSDINAVTVRQCKRQLVKANNSIPIGERSESLNQIAVNIVDYRDQNHVLSTYGNSYGVEAICFNELLANDGSECRTISDYLSRDYNKDLDSDDLVFTDCSVINSGTIYPDLSHKGSAYFNGQKSAWDINFISATKVELLGPSKNQTPNQNNNLWDNNRFTAYEKFCKLRDNLGKYPSKKKKGYLSLTWPDDFFKNCYLNIAFCKLDSLNAQSRNDVINKIKIKSSDKNGVLTLEKSVTKKEETAASGKMCSLFLG